MNWKLGGLGWAGLALLALAGAFPARSDDLFSTPEQRKDVSLTVYNNDLSLVRERRDVPVRKGIYRLRFEGVTAGIDATSVHLEAKNGGVQIVEQNYEFDLISQAKLMQKYVGLEVGYRMKDGGGVGRARLLAANDGFTYEMDGKIVFELPGPIVLDAVPQELSARPTLVWTLEGGHDGTEEIDTAYLSHGLSWRADYVLLLDENEKQGGLTGWVTLNNQSGASFANASLKLVTGDVNRVQPVLEGAMADMGRAMMVKSAAPQFQEETFFEYHLYTLQRRADLKENQQKQVLFFDSDHVGVEKGYTFRAQPQYFYQGFVPPEGSEHVDVSLRFANSKQNGLGSPIPAGILRVYKKDRDGAPQFLGENQVRHTPKDETLEFAVGRAFDIVGDHAQMDYKRVNDRTAEMAYQVKLRNHKDETVKVRVLENFYGDWKILESSHEATKENSRTARFDVTVPPDKETIVTYRVRITT